MTEKSFEENLRIRLCKLFLHCVFSNPEFIKSEISKHLDIPISDVILRYERNRTNEQGDEIAKYFTLFVDGIEFILRYDKRLEEPKEIEVPKVINKPKKWWQVEPEKMVVIEKKKSSETPRLTWVLNAIDR